MVAGVPEARFAKGASIMNLKLITIALTLVSVGVAYLAGTN